MPRSTKAFGGMLNRERVVVEPTRWELFLRELSLSESDAFEVIHRPSETSTKIRNWVNTHYRAVFVPENVLETMGLETGFPDL